MPSPAEAASSPPSALQEDITAVSKSADAIKKRLAELDRSNEQVQKGSVFAAPSG